MATVSFDDLLPEPPVSAEGIAICGCKVDGPQRNVVVDIDEGHIIAVICAHCELPVLSDDPGLGDGFEGVHATGVPLLMTTTVEKRPEHRGFGMHEDVDVVFHQLSEPLGDE
jgi:hypothetical protein